MLNFNCDAVLFWLHSITGAVDTEYLKKVGLDVFFKSFMTLYDWLTQDELVQVNGVVFLSDYTDITMQKFTTIFNADRQKDVMSYFEVKRHHIFTQTNRGIRNEHNL